MWDTNGRKIAHMLKRLTWHRKKSSKRHENAIERYILVLKKEAKFGAEDKWVIRTKEKTITRLKKLGILPQTIKEILASRGDTDLSSKVVY